MFKKVFYYIKKIPEQVLLKNNHKNQNICLTALSLPFKESKGVFAINERVRRLLMRTIFNNCFPYRRKVSSNRIRILLGFSPTTLSFFVNIILNMTKLLNETLFIQIAYLKTRKFKNNAKYLFHYCQKIFFCQVLNLFVQNELYFAHVCVKKKLFNSFSILGCSTRLYI